MSNTAYRLIVLVLVAAFLSTAAHAQLTLSPLTVEGKMSVGKHAHGEFTITNSNLVPMNITVEPRNASNGITAVPLDPATATVKLNATSIRIGIKQSFTFGYDIVPRVLPLVVVFSIKASGPHVNNGAAVIIGLPEYSYLCPKTVKRGCRDEILAKWKSVTKN